MFIGRLPSRAPRRRKCSALISPEVHWQQYPGTYGTDYIYPGAADFDYYNGKGLTLIRLPFRWSGSSTLSTPRSIHRNGPHRRRRRPGSFPRMKILLDMHNYDGYTISGTGYTVGAPRCPSAHSRMPGPARRPLCERVGHLRLRPHERADQHLGQLATQARPPSTRSAVRHDPLCLRGRSQLVGSQTWASSNSTLSVTDSANLLVYSAHSYWNANHDGSYGANEQGTATTGVNFASLS